MTPLWKKLNLTTQTGVTILNEPASFAPQSQALNIPLSTTMAAGGSEFLLAFVTKRAEIADIAAQMGSIEGDPVLWFAYPKASSKKYTCDFNRDNGWEPLAELGLRPVRQVAIDSDWSALRFRLKVLVQAKPGSQFN